ncbi:MAG TPA: lysylphosphatidylglycerol synthase transmembrane domain-containing protein [bacterium]|jgi:uncharacterized protein (TIRG00374 family)|nr:lysylphosphatidylglycerol synthase transmembrane domain-containing protein [bacterium]
MLKRAVPFLLAVLCLIPLVLTVNWGQTITCLKSTDPFWCLAGLGCLLVMIYIKGIRWSFLLKMQGSAYSVWNCFLIYMSTLMMGNFTPGRAGDFAKILYLQKDLKFSLGKSMTSTLVDRVFDLYILLILGCVGILTYPMPLDPNLIKAVWAFFVVLIVVTLLAFNQKIGGALLKAVFQRMMKQEHKNKTDVIFNDFHKGMDAFYQPVIFYPVFLTLCSYTAFFTGCYFFALALNVHVSILYQTFVVSVANIVSLLSFLGVGTRDGAVYILYKLVGLQDQAEAFSMLFFFVGVIVFSLIGLGCFYLKPIELGFLSKSQPAKNRSVKKNKTVKKSSKK